MQTDPDIFDANPFDAEASRETSLAATLSRVRLRRRMRKAMGAVAVLCLTALLVRLATPVDLNPQGAVTASNPLIIRSGRLRAEQRLATVRDPGMFVQTTAPETVARVTTSADAAVPRLGEREFHHWLAAHEVYCIQVGTAPAQVLPLHLE
jgi:hypothetical protein